MAGSIASRLAGRPGVLRVAVDGAPATDPDGWAQAIAVAVGRTDRPAVHLRADGFWHDRSLRYEYGRQDVQGYLGWLDHRALRREVLDVVGTATGTYLPSLRDPVTNRSTRAEPQPLPDRAVLIVSGSLLFGLGLPFELTVHLTMTPAALRRRTPEAERWTLPAFAEYDDTVQPVGTADVVVKVDDPRHPALRGR